MFNDKAISSVRSFFEEIFRYAKTNSSTNPAWNFSDKQGVSLAKAAIKDAILSIIHPSISQPYKYGEHLAIRDIS